MTKQDIQRIIDSSIKAIVRNRDGFVDFPESIEVEVPKRREFAEMIEKSGIKTIGKIDPDQFPWPASREESLEIFPQTLLLLLLRSWVESPARLRKF